VRPLIPRRTRVGDAVVDDAYFARDEDWDLDEYHEFKDCHNILMFDKKNIAAINRFYRAKRRTGRGKEAAAADAKRAETEQNGQALPKTAEY